MKKRGPRAYSEEYPREAVRLAESGSKPLAQIARELGIHLETLRSWRRRAQAAGEEAATAGVVPSLEEENRRLRRENARLHEEREILKKGSSRNTGKCRANLEEEIGVIAKTIRHALDHFDLVVDAFEDARGPALRPPSRRSPRPRRRLVGPPG